MKTVTVDQDVFLKMVEAMELAETELHLYAVSYPGNQTTQLCLEKLADALDRADR